MEIQTVKLTIPEGCNMILGQSHFIKTAEDLFETIRCSCPHARFGIAFCEASGPCLIRMEGNDPEMLGVLMLNVSTDHIIRKFKVQDGTAFGFDENGEELVRVPLKEPTVVRPFFDETARAYSYNVT